MRRRDFLKTVVGLAAAVSVWAAPPLRWPFPTRIKNGCPPNDGRTMRLMAVGDIMMHMPVIEAGHIEGDEYDFSPFFEYVRPLFQNADLVIGNLETPLAGSKAGYAGYPNFNAPDALAANLKSAGFSLVTLANNHSLDRGWKGLVRTVEVVKEAGLASVGAFTGPEDRRTPRLMARGGVTVGVLGYTYGVNGEHRNPKNEPWRLNFIDEEIIVADILELKKSEPDFIIVHLHFGLEYHRLPNKFQKSLVAKLFETGADLILGHHPHVVQPGLVEPGDALGQKAAIYSLGNFLSNQSKPFTDQGLILDARLGFDLDGRKILGPITFHPTRCVRRLVKERQTYRILPVYEAAANPAAYGLTEIEAKHFMNDRNEMAWHLLDYQE